MAMPFIIHHDENIYSLHEQEKEEFHPRQKPPLHISKFSKKIEAENNAATAVLATTGQQRVKLLCKTMGYAQVPLNPPAQFLKRGGGVKLEPRKKDHVCYHKNLPPLPKMGGDKKGGNADADGTNGTDAAPMTNGDDDNSGGGGKSELKTIRKIPRYVDSKNGDTHDLKRSGLMPTYVYQANFGKLPKYLIKRIHQAAKQEENFRDAQVRRQPLCRYVTQEERGELLGGLKHNWEELQKDYQGLPVLTDTIPKMQRKTQLESSLKQLEKDILLVENLPYIYVYNSNERA